MKTLEDMDSFQSDSVTLDIDGVFGRRCLVFWAKQTRKENEWNWNQVFGDNINFGLTLWLNNTGSS